MPAAIIAQPATLQAELSALLPRLTPAQLREVDAHLAAIDPWRWRARPKQLPPPGDWRLWLLMAGRGFGKTLTIVEWASAQARTMPGSRGAVVASTASDVRDVLVEGSSGFLATPDPPEYAPSRRALTWRNGSKALLYSAEEPNRLRGPQQHWAICDEIAAWKFAETFDQLMFGLRLGQNPRCAIATTPRPTALIKRLLADPHCVVTRGTTYENQANLAPAFLDQIVKRYEGTRLGRQELNAELLDDTPGALWQRDQLDALRVSLLPDLVRVVVAVDPATTSGADADETGIVAVGLGTDGHYYVLDDRSQRASPDAWARSAVALYHLLKADRLVAETNQGGEMVALTVRTVDPRVAYRAVQATRGKYTRAEPVAALYEQGKVHHLGSLPVLEDQMCTWEQGIGSSPDRCFVAGTLITTDDGDKPIESIRAGDMILTRNGYRRVIESGQTSLSSPVLRLILSYGIILECTENHPIFVPGRGFVEAWKLESGDLVLALASKASNSMAMNFDATRTVSARARGDISIRMLMGTGHLDSLRYTRKFGNSILAPSQTGGTSTTKTAITRTTISATWNHCHRVNTRAGMRNSIRLNSERAARRTWIASAHSPKNGTAAQQGASGIANTANGHGRIDSQSSAFVPSAVKNTNPLPIAQLTGSVPDPALVGTMNAPAAITKTEPVSFVGQCSTSRNPRNNRLVRASVLGVSGVGSFPVYNLTIEDVREYFANGVLVHNCDALVWAITDLMTRAERHTGGMVTY